MRAFGLNVLAAMAFAVGTALAVSPAAGAPPQSSETQQSPSQQSFSEETLKQFAMATVEVQRIGEAYRPQLESAGSSEQRQAIQTQAVDEMVKAVNDVGLSVETYNEVHRAAQADPNLASRIDTYMRDAQ